MSDGEDPEPLTSTKPPPTEKSTDDAISYIAMEVDMSKGVGPEAPREQRTVFVSNLPAEVTKGQLRERFSEVMG